MLHRNFFSAVSVSVASIFIIFLTIHPSVNAQDLSQGWNKVCRKQNDVNICHTLNTVVSSTGQPLTVISLIEIKEKKNENRLGIQVPTNRFLPEGVTVQVGNNFSKKIPYMVCDSSSCIANDVLDDQLIAAMKTSPKMVITTVNFRGSPNPIEFSLDGFTAAYAGSGVEEEAFQKEQMKLREAIRSKKKEIEDRMRAEQEEAKKRISK